ncbi:pore-forming ESAT-6 family protein [Paracoccus ravus]|uniref:pore-forming ESAT-6 family protein n=1 Tax=Paracoccus ravus TaxID=2447760 RepID=UPI00106DE030|nr:pore-forming ESAT-6 family protein [Paracoccus ravus]
MIARPALLSAVTFMTFATAAPAQEASPAVTAPATTEAVAAPTGQPVGQAVGQAVGQPDMAAAYENARNQLGVLSYCQDKGYIDGRAVETQMNLLAMIPPGDTAAGDAAETKGKTGTVSAMGVERSLSDAALQQEKTEDALCDEMDSLLHELASRISG